MVCKNTASRPSSVKCVPCETILCRLLYTFDSFAGKGKQAFNSSASDPLVEKELDRTSKSLWFHVKHLLITKSEEECDWWSCV